MKSSARTRDRPPASENEPEAKSFLLRLSTRLLSELDNFGTFVERKQEMQIPNRRHAPRIFLLGEHSQDPPINYAVREPQYCTLTKLVALPNSFAVRLLRIHTRWGCGRAQDSHLNPRKRSQFLVSLGSSLAAPPSFRNGFFFFFSELQNGQLAPDAEMPRRRNLTWPSGAASESFLSMRVTWGSHCSHLVASAGVRVVSL